MNRRHYKVSARHWFTMDLVQLEYDGKKASFNGSRHIYAPSEYSYRCESVSSSYYAQLSPHSDKDNANDWQISFEDFQVSYEAKDNYTKWFSHFNVYTDDLWFPNMLIEFRL